jgi:hypothetical protein
MISARQRAELLAATEKELARIAARVQRARSPLRGAAAIGQAVGAVLGRRHMAKHFHFSITDDTFSFAQNPLSIGRRLLQQVHGMTPISYLCSACRFYVVAALPSCAALAAGSALADSQPCRRNPPWARRRRTRTKLRASPSSRCFPSHPPQGWQ